MDSNTNAHSNAGLNTREQIGVIFADVQTMKTDIAVMKATSVTKRVHALEKEVDTLKGRVIVLWVAFAGASTIITAIVLKGLGV